MSARNSSWHSRPSGTCTRDGIGKPTEWYGRQSFPVEGSLPFPIYHKQPLRMSVIIRKAVRANGARAFRKIIRNRLNAYQCRRRTGSSEILVIGRAQEYLGATSSVIESVHGTVFSASLRCRRENTGRGEGWELPFVSHGSDGGYYEWWGCDHEKAKP